MLVGRPVLWALAADSARGVRDALLAPGEDLSHVMALAGTPELSTMDPSMVVAL